jgi:hypothetical protein
MHDQFGCDICRRAGAVFNDEWLAQPLRQPLPMMRAMMSVLPPGEKPTIRYTGRLGYDPGEAIAPLAKPAIAVAPS